MVLCRVTMLDASTFEVEVDKAAEGKVLLDKICSHLNIIEADYFGLTYIGARDVKFWLATDKKIAKQLKGGCRWVFEFAVKFYPPEPQMLQEDIARYQLCLQLRFDLFNGKLPCSFITHAILGSYTVQAELGDFDPKVDGPDSSYLRDFDFAPKQNQELLDKISEIHKTHKGQTPEEAELNFLENAKKLAMYGVDIHKAKDSEGVNINLGVCASGLVIYRDKLRLNRFVWPKIIKLSYKRNNFYIQIRPENERENKDDNFCFRLENHKMAKRLWKTCVEHHAFFRLKEADQQKAGSLFPRFNSRFRYSGRTQKQLKDRTDLIDKPKENFERTWKNKPMPYSDGQNRKLEDEDHPLDAKDRQDRLGGDPNAHISTGGPPPYSKENDMKGMSRPDQPVLPGDASDRTDQEGNKEATLDAMGAAGDASTLPVGASVAPGSKKGKKSKEEKEREKREKEEEKRRKRQEEEEEKRRKKEEEEEEKRRKREEEKERKRLEKEKKKHNKSTSEDITDQKGDQAATETAPEGHGMDAAGLQKIEVSQEILGDQQEVGVDKEVSSVVKATVTNDLDSSVVKKSEKKKEVKFVDENKSDEKVIENVINSGEANVDSVDKSRHDSSTILMADAADGNVLSKPLNTELNKEQVTPDENIEDEVFETESKSNFDKTQKMEVNLAVVRTENIEKRKSEKESVSEQKCDVQSSTEVETSNIQVKSDRDSDTGKECEKEKISENVTEISKDKNAVAQSESEDVKTGELDKGEVIQTVKGNKDMAESHESEKGEAEKTEKKEEKTKDEIKVDKKELKRRQKEEKQKEKERKKQEKEQKKKEKEEKKRLEKERKKQEKEKKKSKKSEPETKEAVVSETDVENKSETEVAKEEKQVDPVQIELAAALAQRKGKSESDEEPDQDIKDIDETDQGPAEASQAENKNISSLEGESKSTEKDDASASKEDKVTSEERETGKKKGKKEKKKKEKKKKEKNQEENPGCFAFIKKPKVEVVEVQEEPPPEDLPTEPWIKEEVQEQEVKAEEQEMVKVTPKQKGVGLGWALPAFEEMKERQAAVAAKAETDPDKTRSDSTISLKSSTSSSSSSSQGEHETKAPLASDADAEVAGVEGGIEGTYPDWPFGKEGSIDRKMDFIPVTAPSVEVKEEEEEQEKVKVTPTQEVKDRNGVAEDNTMPFFDPASQRDSDGEGTLGKKVPPPVAPKSGRKMNGDMSEEERRLQISDDGLIHTDIPPTVPTESVKYSTDLEDKTISTTNFPIVKTETRTVTYEKDGFPVETEDCILISSQSHSTRTQTFETTTYRTEIDGNVETRVEKKIIISEDGDDIDHDQLLADAIRSVTEMNQDLSVERIECMRQLEDEGYDK